MPRYPRPTSLSYSFGPGPITPAVKWIIWVERRGVRRDGHLPRSRRRARADPAGRDRAPLALAAGHVHVPARGHRRTSCSTCWASGCSASSWSGCGARSSSLRTTRSPASARRSPRSSSRCCRSRSTAATYSDDHRRRLGRALRPAARLCAVLSRPADPDVPALSRFRRNTSSSSSARLSFFSSRRRTWRTPRTSAA